ncbi:NACHT domain-containing protein [Nonomuraea sp. NPDC050153]|uniref:NACHT domain-containing protein n=1 Tax=Nonomuraea sp. NPDC050153 TaxID=3364359 RepID=UPI00378A7B96
MAARYWQNRQAKMSVVLGVLLLALATVLLTVAGQLPKSWGITAGSAQLIVAVTGAIGLGNGLVQFLSWWRKRGATAAAPTSADVATAKDVLSGLVTQQWRDETVLRSLCDPEPMPLPWHSTERRELADRPEIIAKGTVAFPGLDVHIADMARNFRALRCRRLVILGGPGTGKTTLAVQLVLELLRTREPAEPVPVLLSAARWDDRVHGRLQDWVADSLAMDYPALRAEGLGTDMPETLVARGEVLPVIDGLDELPDTARADMLTALNRSLYETDQLILTCRTEQFAESVEEIGDALTAAAVIEPQPMSTEAAAGYLEACLPPVPHSAWPQVLEELREGTAPALSEVTSTSMGLWLVRATYIAPRVDPAPLLELGHGSAAELHDHLCDQLIPALVSTRTPAPGTPQPFRPQHAWTPEQVDRWLTYLSRQLASNEEDPRDVAWWHLARYTSSRTVRFGAAIAIGVAVWLAFWALTRAPFVSAMAGLFSALVAETLIGSWFTESPGHADFHLRGRLAELMPALRDGLIVGALGAIVGWLMAYATNPQSALRSSVQLGVLSFVGFVSLLSLIRWVESPTADLTARSPRSTWQADRNLTVIRILGGLVVGLAAAGVLLFSGLPSTVAVVVGLALGLLFGLVLGRHHAWLAYKLTVPRLAGKGRLPLRAMDFLDDAHRLGLLRTEGPYYQFRHIELQRHLADGRHTAPVTPQVRVAPHRGGPGGQHGRM